MSYDDYLNNSDALDPDQFEDDSVPVDMDEQENKS